jgi:hypothetical protein
VSVFVQLIDEQNLTQARLTMAKLQLFREILVYVNNKNYVYCILYYILKITSFLNYSKREFRTEKQVKQPEVYPW